MVRADNPSFASNSFGDLMGSTEIVKILPERARHGAEILLPVCEHIASHLDGTEDGFEEGKRFLILNGYTPFPGNVVPAKYSLDGFEGPGKQLLPYRGPVPAMPPENVIPRFDSPAVFVEKLHQVTDPSEVLFLLRTCPECPSSEIAIRFQADWWRHYADRLDKVARLLDSSERRYTLDQDLF